MNIYISQQTAYSSQKKKNIPVGKLDITTATITYFDAETGKTEKKSYNTDYVRYHLPFSASQYPDRLRKLVNNGQIIAYPDDLEQ